MKWTNNLFECIERWPFTCNYKVIGDQLRDCKATDAWGMHHYWNSLNKPFLYSRWNGRRPLNYPDERNIYIDTMHVMDDKWRDWKLICQNLSVDEAVD